MWISEATLLEVFVPAIFLVLLIFPILTGLLLYLFGEYSVRYSLIPLITRRIKSPPDVLKVWVPLGWLVAAFLCYAFLLTMCCSTMDLHAQVSFDLSSRFFSLPEGYSDAISHNAANYFWALRFDLGILLGLALAYYRLPKLVKPLSILSGLIFTYWLVAFALKSWVELPDVPRLYHLDFVASITWYDWPMFLFLPFFLAPISFIFTRKRWVMNARPRTGLPVPKWRWKVDRTNQKPPVAPRWYTFLLIFLLLAIVGGYASETNAPPYTKGSDIYFLKGDEMLLFPSIKTDTELFDLYCIDTDTGEKREPKLLKTNISCFAYNNHEAVILDNTGTIQLYDAQRSTFTRLIHAPQIRQLAICDRVFAVDTLGSALWYDPDSKELKRIANLPPIARIEARENWIFYLSTIGFVFRSHLSTSKYSSSPDGYKNTRITTFSGIDEETQKAVHKAISVPELFQEETDIAEIGVDDDCIYLLARNGAFRWAWSWTSSSYRLSSNGFLKPHIDTSFRLMSEYDRRSILLRRISPKQYPIEGSSRLKHVVIHDYYNRYGIDTDDNIYVKNRDSEPTVLCKVSGASALFPGKGVLFILAKKH